VGQYCSTRPSTLTHLQVARRELFSGPLSVSPGQRGQDSSSCGMRVQSALGVVMPAVFPKSKRGALHLPGQADTWLRARLLPFVHTIFVAGI